MTAQTFLISGATGFLGSHFVRTLLSLGYNVVGLKRASSNLWRLANVLQNKNLSLYNSDDADLQKVFSEQDIDAVIHTACSYGKNGDLLFEMIDTNVVFGLKLFIMCERFGVSVFFNTDSFFNTGNLANAYMNNYTLSKRHLVEWLLQCRIKTKIYNMKVHHMYGLNDSDRKFIPWFIHQLEQNVTEIPLTEGLQMRDFIFVEDVISAYLTVFKNSENLSHFIEFDVGTGRQVTLKEFVSEIVSQYKIQHPENKSVLKFGSVEYYDGELMSVEENVEPLYELGWRAKFNYKEGIKLILTHTPPLYYNSLYYNNLHCYNSISHLCICCGFYKEAA